jgi:hypothetical protein
MSGDRVVVARPRAVPLDWRSMALWAIGLSPWVAMVLLLR